jgi:hypothetical protein
MENWFVNPFAGLRSMFDVDRMVYWRDKPMVTFADCAKIEAIRKTIDTHTDMLGMLAGAQFRVAPKGGMALQPMLDSEYAPYLRQALATILLKKITDQLEAAYKLGVDVTDQYELIRKTREQFDQMEASHVPPDRPAPPDPTVKFDLT